MLHIPFSLAPLGFPPMDEKLHDNVRSCSQWGLHMALLPVDVLVSSDDITWSLTFVHVPIFCEDSLSHQSTLVLYFSSPLHHGARKGEDNATYMTNSHAKIWTLDLLTSCIIVEYIQLQSHYYKIASLYR